MPRWVGSTVVVLVGVVVLAVLVAGAAVLIGDPGARRAAPEPAGPTSPSTSTTSRPPTTPTTPASDPVDPGTDLSPCPLTQGAAVAVRVLSFNLHGAIDRENRYRIDQVAAEIRAWDPDVVLVQEIHRFRPLSGLADMPADLARRTGLDDVFATNFTRAATIPGTPRRRTGTAVLSRFDVLGRRNTALPRRPGTEQRGLLRVTLGVEGRQVDVYDTHLEPGGARLREQQVRAVGRVIDAREARRERPFLLGGDFNSEPDSSPMVLARRIATDPWDAVGVGVGETVRPREPRARVDYLLHGPGWRATRSETLLSEVSDHRALLTRFVLEPGRDCS